MLENVNAFKKLVSEHCLHSCFDIFSIETGRLGGILALSVSFSYITSITFTETAHFEMLKLYSVNM